MSGFIKLHRRMLQWEWAAAPSTLVVFVHLLLRANYEPRRWRGLELLPGQVVTGRAALAEQTGLSEKQIRTALKNLEKTGEVAIKTTRQFSLISITKWADYQDRGQQRANKGPTEGQQRATLKESKKVRRKESKNPPIPQGGASPRASRISGRRTHDSGAAARTRPRWHTPRRSSGPARRRLPRGWSCT